MRSRSHFGQPSLSSPVQTGSPWLRFRSSRNGGLKAYLPEGKLVLVDRQSPFKPDGPGRYYAAEIVHLDRVAFVHLVECHRSLKFSRSECFGSTQDGKTWICRHYPVYKKKPLPFILDPAREKLECLGVQFVRLEFPDGAVYKYQHKNRIRWQLVEPGYAKDVLPCEIHLYEAKFQNVAAYRRTCTGCPTRLYVIMNPEDDLDEARRIAPPGSWTLESLRRRDPDTFSDRNALLLAKPAEGQTLEDTRKDWDTTPPDCY